MNNFEINESVYKIVSGDLDYKKGENGELLLINKIEHHEFVIGEVDYCNNMTNSWSLMVTNGYGLSVAKVTNGVKLWLAKSRNGFIVTDVKPGRALARLFLKCH